MDGVCRERVHYRDRIERVSVVRRYVDQSKRRDVGGEELAGE